MTTGTDDGWYARGERAFVWVRGEERVELLHRLSTRNLEPLKTPGRVEWTVFTTSQGKMVDWVAVYSLEDGLLLRVSKGRDAEMVEWLQRYIIMEDVEVEVVSEQWADFVVDSAQALPSLGLSERPAQGSWVGMDGALVASGLEAYGERLELIVPADKTEQVQAAFTGAGIEHAEPDFVEQVRVSAGVPSPNYEYAKPLNPLELRLVATSISWNKGCYIGQEVISRLDSYDKVARMLMGVRAGPELTLTPGARLQVEGKRVGKLTSWHVAAGVGLAIVERSVCKPGPCEIQGEDGLHPAELLDCPFWT